MLDHELRNQEPPITWDNTLRTTFKSCPRKMYWFLRRYDYSPDTKPPYFVWGAAWQEILASWYNIAEQTDPGTLANQERMALAMLKGWEYWDSNGCVESTSNTRDNLEVKFKQYTKEYPREPWTFTKDSMEIGWEWPIRGTPWYLGGALDGKIGWKNYGILILENKTTGGYLSDAHLAQWDYSSQVKTYDWYGDQSLGSDYYGVLMNLITKLSPGPRSNWKTPTHARITVKKEPWQREEFEEDFVKDIELFLRSWNDWYWPMTTDHISCVGGPGKGKCLFRYLCLSDAPYQEEDPIRYPGIVHRKDAWEPWKRGHEEVGE